jgi:hypothetical protein
VTDQNTSAGATPAAGGATPPQSAPAQPATGSSTSAGPAASSQPATGADDALGEKGLKALEAERTARREAEDARKAAEKALEDLKFAQSSDAEKALAQAKKDGATAERTKLEAAIRRSEVRAALTGAGINGSLLDLAVKADDFAALTISDDGSLDGLEAALETFKKGHADLFTKAPANGSADGGSRGSRPTFTREQLAAMTPAEYAKNRDQILEQLATSKP